MADNEKIDFSGTRHVPANYCHLRHTNEEFLIDFGMTGADQESPKAIVDTSIVLSPYTAKRLFQSLGQLVGNYEQHFGEIHTNFEDRLIAQQPMPMQGQPPIPAPQAPQAPQAPRPAPQAPQAPMHVPVPPQNVQQLGNKPTESINRPPRGFLPKGAAFMGTIPAEIPDVVLDVPEDGTPVVQEAPEPQQAPPPNNSPCNPAEEP